MMKEKLLFIMFVAMASWGWGQSLSYESLKISTGIAASNGLVRSWTPTSAVLYYRDASQGVFSVIDNPLLMSASAVLPQGFEVNDFQILDDVVYCCGSYQGKGMLAYFKINDIIPGSTLQMEVTQLAKSTAVTRMAVAPGPNRSGIFIAAVGEGIDDSSQRPVSYMIECDNYTNGLFFARERECFFSMTPIVREHLFDVEMVGEYVCFVGLLSNENTITLRKGHQSNLFYSGLLDNLYLYPIDYVPLSSIVSTSIDIDAVAVAGTFADQSESFTTQIRTFDISTMSMTGAQQMPLGGKCDVCDMQYLSPDTILLLQRDSDPSRGSYVVYVDPGSTAAYTASTFYSSDMYDFSRVGVHYRNHYLLAGRQQWMLQHVSPTYRENYCYVQNCKIISLLETNEFLVDQDNHYVWSSSFFILSANCVYHQFDLVCQYR